MKIKFDLSMITAYLFRKCNIGLNEFFYHRVHRGRRCQAHREKTGYMLIVFLL